MRKQKNKTQVSQCQNKQVGLRKRLSIPDLGLNEKKNNKATVRASLKEQGREIEKAIK